MTELNLMQPSPLKTVDSFADDRVCTICSGDFDIETEGGVDGYFGILPVSFCPTCKACVFDFVEQYRPGFDCPECGHYIEE